ncbi:hypothetical protein BH09MYX1_BH09MYX1_03070 [soil metagenome]
MTTSSDLQRYLGVQDLKAEDIEANRAGNVSPRQAAIAKKHRSRTSSYLYIVFPMFLAATLFTAVTLYRQNHQPIVFLGPALVFVLWPIMFAVYAAFWRFPLLAGRKVVLVQGRATWVRFLATRGEYSVRMDGVAYRGFGRVDHTYQGVYLKMYVVPDGKIVVGIEPWVAQGSG